MRSYLAFRHRNPRLFGNDFYLSRLRKFARQVNDEYALDLYEQYEDILADDKDISSAHGLVQWVINFPWKRRWADCSPAGSEPGI